MINFWTDVDSCKGRRYDSFASANRNACHCFFSIPLDINLPTLSLSLHKCFITQFPQLQILHVSNLYGCILIEFRYPDLQARWCRRCGKADKNDEHKTSHTARRIRYMKTQKGQETAGYTYNEALIVQHVSTWPNIEHCTSRCCTMTAIIDLTPLCPASVMLSLSSGPTCNIRLVDRAIAWRATPYRTEQASRRFPSVTLVAKFWKRLGGESFGNIRI